MRNCRELNFSIGSSIRKDKIGFRNAQKVKSGGIRNIAYRRRWKNIIGPLDFSLEYYEDK